MVENPNPNPQKVMTDIFNVSTRVIGYQNKFSIKKELKNQKSMHYHLKQLIKDGDVVWEYICNAFVLSKNK